MDESFCEGDAFCYVGFCVVEPLLGCFEFGRGEFLHAHFVAGSFELCVEGFEVAFVILNELVEALLIEPYLNPCVSPCSLCGVVNIGEAGFFFSFAGFSETLDFVHLVFGVFSGVEGLLEVFGVDVEQCGGFFGIAGHGKCEAIFGNIFESDVDVSADVKGVHGGEPAAEIQLPAFETVASMSKAVDGVLEFFKGDFVNAGGNPGAGYFLLGVGEFDGDFHEELTHVFVETVACFFDCFELTAKFCEGFFVFGIGFFEHLEASLDFQLETGNLLERFEGIEGSGFGEMFRADLGAVGDIEFGDRGRAPFGGSHLCN